MYTIVLEAIKRGFTCDPEDSHAVATITNEIIPPEPVPYSDPLPERHIYTFSINVRIGPYPNEMNYGGYFSSFTMDDKAAMRFHLKRIEDEFALYKQIGMTDVHITDKRGQMIPKQAALL